MEKKLVVFCHGGSGPTYCCVKLNGSKEQFYNGIFYEVAKLVVSDLNFDNPMVVCDEDDELFKDLYFQDEDWCFVADEVEDYLSDCVKD